MAAGHRAAEAEAWVAPPGDAIDPLALISLRMWDAIAADDPQPRKRQMKALVDEWVTFRRVAA
jgi:hypothetical protein